MNRLRLLILGGTSEASGLARRIADEPDVTAILSLAGATANPAPAPIPRRIGGFGGAEGLAAYIARERIGAVVDATHPFASRMSANAVAACRASDTPLIAFTRPPWTRKPGDRWIEVATIDEAVAALGAEPKTVFLTQGRLQLGAFLERRSIVTSCARSILRRRSKPCPIASSYSRADRSRSPMSSSS